MKSGILSGFQVDVPVHADAKALPLARLSGVSDASVEVLPVAEGAWIARIHSTAALAPDAFWPNENGFQLDVADSKGLPVRIALDDSSDGWTGSVEAVVRSIHGDILSGVDPVPALRTYSQHVPTSLLVDVVGTGYQSRGTDLAWTKPILALHNESDRRLESMDVLYHVQARDDGAKPVIELWNVPHGVGTGSASVVADGAGGWLAVIQLRGANLLPGQELKELKFGLHWPDWAPWDASRDGSEPGSTDARGVSLAVVDHDALVAMGTPPEDPVVTTSWRVEGFDEGLSDPRQIKPRLRLTNLGNTVAEGLTLRIPFVAPTGTTPVLESWFIPGCTGSLGGAGSAQAVLYTCPNVRVPPGGMWPDAAGLVFGVHDANWSSWPRGGDALTRELGGSWKTLTTPEVVP